MRTIRVHNRGGLDWERPAVGRFGAFGGGMFGTWPVYCRAEGYDFGVIDESTVEAVDLRGVQTLVLVNSPKIWDQRQRRTIYDFVVRGGSLLVLGDHTGVFGLMRGFNSLFSPLGIQFRFDSAYRRGSPGAGARRQCPTPCARAGTMKTPASRLVHRSSYPDPLGRCWSAAMGFPIEAFAKMPSAAFWETIHYDRGEQLGDTVLAATATYGRGRVVVWGDTPRFRG